MALINSLLLLTTMISVKATTQIEVIEKILSEKKPSTPKNAETFVFSAFNSIDNALIILNIIYRYSKEVFMSNPAVLDTAISLLLDNSSPQSIDIIKWLIEKKAVFSPNVIFGFLEHDNLEAAKLLCAYLIETYPTIVVMCLKKTLERGNILFAEFVVEKYAHKEDVMFFLIKFLPTKKDIANLFDVMKPLLNDYKIGLLTILAISEGNTKLLDKLIKNYGFRPFNQVPESEWFPLFRFLVSEKKNVYAFKWFVYRKYKNDCISALEKAEIRELAKKHLKQAEFKLVVSYLDTYCC